MSNIQTGAERMPHDLSHLGFLAGQIGRLITISTTPVIAGDSFEMDAVGAQIGRAVQQECRDRDLHSFPTRRSSDLPFPSWLPCWSDWSSYYHFNYSGYRWRLLRDGRRWRSDRKSGSAGMPRPRSTLFPYTTLFRSTFPILASLLVRLVVLLPFQLLRLSLATPSRWTPLALSVFLHCVVALLLTLL